MDFETIRTNLERKGYRVQVFRTKEEAAAFLDRMIDGKTVGIGGCVTAQQMGLYGLLSGHNTVYSLEAVPEGMTVMGTRKASSLSQVYISSVNGIAETGEIVNIDNTGNRVSAIAFGPDLVCLVAGKNKIAKDLEGAIWRARNVAAPQNAKRLSRKTPCAVLGDRCYDCSSPDRICRNLSVLWTKPVGAEYLVLLIDEELGY